MDMKKRETLKLYDYEFSGKYRSKRDFYDVLTLVCKFLQTSLTNKHSAVQFASVLERHQRLAQSYLCWREASLSAKLAED